VLVPKGSTWSARAGCWPGLTKTVLETALETEMAEHLGYDKHDPAGRTGGNSRNGSPAKTVLTEVGPVQIEVPRDRVRVRPHLPSGIRPDVLSSRRVVSCWLWSG
jgi:hypothetical protein